jgi:hypothetical protein
VASRIADGPCVAFDLAETLPLVHLDPRRARVLFLNLIEMFTVAAQSAKSSVGVKTSAIGRAPAARVSVEMATYGIPGGAIAQLGCGSSLCLESAKRMVEAHGGEFQYEIEPSGIRLRMVLQ